MSEILEQEAELLLHSFRPHLGHLYMSAGWIQLHRGLGS